MNRFYSSNQLLSGLGGLIADAVQTRQQVHAQEAAARDRANMQIYGGMGEGLGNIARNYASTKLHLQDQAMHNAQQMALQNAQTLRYQNLENQRSANDIYEQSLKTWDALQYGGGKGASLQSPMIGGMPTEQGIGTNMDGSVMMPQQATPPSGEVPSPAIDPANTAAYRDAEQKRNELIQQGMRIQLSKAPPAEKAAALRELTPQLYESTQMLRRYQRPQPTMRDMVQQQTWTDPNSGVIYHPKEIAVTNGPKSQTENKVEWKDAPTPEVAEAMKVADFNAKTHVDSQGRTWKLDPKGGDWELVKEEQSKSAVQKPKDYAKEAQAKYKAWLSSKAKEGVPASNDPVQIHEKEQELAFRMEIADKNPETISLDEYKELAARLMQTYGSPEKVPHGGVDGDLWSEFWALGSKFRAPAEPGDFGD